MTSLKIFSAIPKVAKAIGAISKTRRNQQQGYQFRGIDDVLNACHDPLTDNGVFCATEVSDLVREERQSKSGGALIYTTLKLKVTFYAEDGSSISTTTFGEAMDSADKSINKAMSAALKYAFFQTFTIPLEEDDADKTTHEPLPRQQQQNGSKKLPEMSDAEREFREWVKPFTTSKEISSQEVADIVASYKRDFAAAQAEITKLLAVRAEEKKLAGATA